VDALLTQALSSFLREETLKGNLPKKQKERKKEVEERLFSLAS